MSDGATQPKSTGDSALEHLFDPIVLNRPERTIPGPIRVTLLNACGGTQLEPILACLARPPLDRSSLILLCESDWETLRSGKRQIAAELAERLQMSFAYVPEFGIPVGDGTHGSFLGNAILSAMPMREVRAIAMPLPRPREASRALLKRVGFPAGLVGKVILRGREVSIGVVHLSSHCSPAARDEQMSHYLAGFPAGGPAIMGGDLNSTTAELLRTSALMRTCARMLVNPGRFRRPQRYEPMFERIAAAGLRIDGVNAPGKPTFTFGRVIPPILRPKLDWFAVRDLDPVSGSAKVIPARQSFFSSRVSDHDFVTVELTV